MKKIMAVVVFAVVCSLFLAACKDKDEKKQRALKNAKEQKVEIAKDNNQEIYNLVKSGNPQELAKFAKPKNVNLVDQDGNNALLIAAGEYDRAEVIDILIKAGADTEIRNKNGYTPLMLAIRNGRAQNALVLIKAGANVNAAYDKPYDDMDKTTPLMYAVGEPDVNEPRVVQALIDAGADVNAKNAIGNTPLLIAARDSWLKPENLEILIKAGANIEEKNKNGYTPLMVAIRNGRTENALVLIKAGANVNAAYDKPYDDMDKTTPLMYAVGEPDVNEPRVVQALIDAGADVNAKNAIGNTPLLIAARDSWLKPENLEILIKSGANIEEKNKNGYTPLLVAIQNGRTQNALVLIKAGANVNTVFGENKITPLMYAVGEPNVNEPRVVQALIDAGANVNAKNAIGDTPLLIAARDSWLKSENLEILIKSGANLEEKNKNGYTPLMVAIQNARTQNALVLIKAGANVNTVFGENKITPLMYAMEAGIDPVIVKALIDYGADVNAKDAKGQSVFDYSQKSYSKDKVKEYTQILLAAKNKK